MKYDHEDIRPVKDAAERRLLALPGVNAVEISEKHTDGKETGELSITVSVDRKKTSAQIPDDERIPSEINGIKTDVVESGRIIALGGPYKGGIDAQSKSSLGGTIGGFAMTTGPNPKAVLLTNQHVLFRGTDVSKRDFRVGPTACSICSPCCSEYIARVLDPANPARVFAVLNDLVDAAIAVLDPGVRWLKKVHEIGPVTGVRPVTAADLSILRVQKYGVTTHKTVGKVRSITLSGPINSQNGVLHRNVRNQIRIEADSGSFAEVGDSGALVLDLKGKAVGLLFGKGPSGQHEGHGFACRIEDVTASLQIDIATQQVDDDIIMTVPGAVPMSAVNPEDVAPAAAIRGEDLQFLLDAQEEILRTPKGRYYSEIIRRNRFEVRRLIDSNPRVAAAWRRNHGPEIVRLLIEGVRSRRLETPAVIDQQRVSESAEKIGQVIAKYASPRLRADLQEHAEEFGRLIGLNYAQLLFALQESDA